MWTIKAILLPLVVAIGTILALLALFIVPILIPESRPYYRKGLALAKQEISKSVGIHT